MLSLTAFADELEREKARQRTYDAMLRKARAGHVTGGRVFGYDNVELVGRRWPAARMSSGASTTRRPSIVRRIFEHVRDGTGYTRISKALNAEACPARGRSRVGRRAGHRHPFTRSSNGRCTRCDPLEPNHEAEPVGRAQAVDTPKQRVDDASRRRSSGSCRKALWDAARARLGGIKAQLEQAAGKSLGGRRRDIDSQYLMPGFSRCGVCGGALCVHDAQARQEPATVLRLRVEPQARRLRVQQPDDRPDEPCRCRRIRAPRR